MYDTIKAQMTSSLPYAATTGIEILMVGPGQSSAQLQQRPEISNHIGSMHAGALFTLGETASGAAMSGAFAEKLFNVRPIATEATINYIKIAKGTIKAEANTEKPAQKLLETLSAEGRVTFGIEVTLTNESGQTVATMRVGWLVSSR